MLRSLLLLISLPAFSLVARADFDAAGTAPNEHYLSYYRVDETAAQPQSGFETPLSMMTLEDLRELSVDVTKWLFSNSEWPEPTEKYNREKHFGPWKDDPTDKSCLNTRGKVLVRDSQGTVEYTSSGCTVKTGYWHEPYLDASYTNAQDIQIDHVVALKNAYISGAWQWDAHSRCVYANYMGNDFHLISVDGRQNMRKGDQTPATWMPPNRAYTCTYLKNWLSIKLIWKLLINPKEAAAVERSFKDAGCDISDFKMKAAELRRQRQIIASNNWCY